jgi:hypothetical protein
MQNKKVFTVGNKLFWTLLLLILFFSFFHFADFMFNKSNITYLIVKKEMPIVIDTTSNNITDSSKVINDSVSFTWNWRDYNKIKREIRFKLSKKDLSQTRENRIQLIPNINLFDPWSCFPGVYYNMYQNDRKYLASIVKAYKSAIKSNAITNYQECLNFVVSSIQSIGYTFICSGEPNSTCGRNGVPDEDCRPPKHGFIMDDYGCCDNIIPLAVYSPFEFAFQKTGDCDTKALFAYTILKELGFKNVAVLVGNTDGGGHSMLGVKLPNPPYNDLYVEQNDGSKYFAWEVTQGDNKLGQACWRVWNDWRISIN